MKKMLIINPSQFGYQTSIFYLCKYLSKYFDIAYLCWDFKKKKIDIDGIKVFYISRNGNKLLRNIKLLKTVSKILNKNNYEIVFIKYFHIMSSIIKFLNPKYKFILDIRSGSVEKKTIYRFFNNLMMITILKNFKYKTVISNGLARQLKIENDAYILPLGAETFSIARKKFDKINLLYIGTLTNRNIEQSVSGFAKFYRKYHNKIEMSYKIVGSGKKADELLLTKRITDEKMDGLIQFIGPIPITEVKPYFEICNIGVSYIPMTNYFDVQPPTKTFEYLLSGMPVIATKISENAKVINKNNGTLIEDNSDNFCLGLEELYSSIRRYDSKKIIKESDRYSWYHIAKNFYEYLKRIM